MMEKTGSRTGLLVIDTASPAFARLFDDPNWTNSGPQVRQAMEIAQGIARETNWHVMVVYHENKSGTGASGSYEWQATADVVTSMKRNEDLTKPEGTVSIRGRLLSPPAPVTFRLEDGLLFAIDNAEVSAQNPPKPKMAGDNLNYWTFLKKLPVSEETAWIQSHVFDVFSATNNQADGLVLSQTKVRNFLKHGQAKGEIQVRRIPEKKNSVIVWHTPNSDTDLAFADMIVD